ncbi:unnamed protein product [Haemonchus placei]|uniref:BPTI/Kunitz inhibitor domain-containing protein n=1 Tax=Haemonchus placei TaxID=6290 RepID=A0A3P7VJ89_HAEPC|nr:unnamed protein product [Haemonchus placei]
MVTVSVSSLLCTDGSVPLIEANEAFPCSKGCPKGFVCEMQDTLLTPPTGICCPNRTELRLIYGNDNRKHTDPKWDQKDSTELTAPSTSREKRPCRSSESDSLSSLEEDDIPCGNITVTVSENDEVFDETSPASVTLDVQATVSSDSVDSVATDEASHSEQSAVTQEQGSMISTKEKDGPIEERTTPTLLPLDVPGDGEMQNGSATVGDTSDVDALEGSAVPVEVSIVVSSGKVDDDTLVEEPDLHGPDPQIEPRSGKQRSSDLSKVDHDTERKAAATKSQDGPIALTGAGTKDLLPQDNTTVETVHEESNRTIDGPEHSSKVHIISKIGKEIRNDTLAFINERTTYSCKKQPSRCLTDSVDAQPTIRWYLSEKGKCEYYSWKFCPGDRAAESLTIRTKADCERKCLKSRKGSAKKALTEVSKGFSGKNEKTGTDVQTQSEAQELNAESDGTPSIAAERSAPVDSDLEEQLRAGLPISEHDKVLNETIAEQGLEDMDLHEGSAMVAEPEIFPTTDDGSVLSNMSSTEKVEPGEAQDHGFSANASQNQGTETKVLNAVATEAEENEEEKKLEKPTVTEVVKAEIEESVQKGSESAKGADKGGEEKNKRVLCSRTTYRFFCKSGKPSQFVYRWERKDGKCHSFPYGYCLHEWNHPHPRTPGECQLFC